MAAERWKYQYRQILPKHFAYSVWAVIHLPSFRFDKAFTIISFKKERGVDTKSTYASGTSGVVFTFGWTTGPMVNMPPPFFPSRQWANIFLTFPAAASCEITDALACPKPRIPSTAWVDAPSSPDCLDEHLCWIKKM